MIVERTKVALTTAGLNTHLAKNAVLLTPRANLAETVTVIHWLVRNPMDLIVNLYVVDLLEKIVAVFVMDSAIRV
jgi:hypothetical protein